MPPIRDSVLSQLKEVLQLQRTKLKRLFGSNITARVSYASNTERTSSSRDGVRELTSSPPLTASNPFFLISSRSGRIAASRQSSLRSDPERPSVRAARWGMERLGLRVVLESI